MPDNEKLKKLWNGKAEYVQDGSTLYRVVYPNGKDDPVFIPTTDESLYGSLSGGMTQAPEPPTINPPKRQAPVTKKTITKNADVG